MGRNSHSRQQRRQSRLSQKIASKNGPTHNYEAEWQRDFEANARERRQEALCSPSTWVGDYLGDYLWEPTGT
jgi:hypothetical protein